MPDSPTSSHPADASPPASAPESPGVESSAPVPSDVAAQATGVSAPPPTPMAHPPFPKDAKLSEQLAYLHAVFAHRPMQLRDMIGVLGAHAPLLLIILLALPFATPLPVPLSIPFGIAIVIVALAVLRGKEPRFSEKVLNARFPAGVHDKLVRFSKRVIGWFERWLRPGRAAVILSTPARERVHVAGLVLAAVFLASPLPFSNFLPAWAILFVTAGLLGRDGGFVMIGHFFFLLGLVCLAFLGGVLAFSGNAIIDWFRHLF